MNKNQIKFVKCINNYDLSVLVGFEFISLIKTKPNAVLGLATGSSPIGVYEQLVKAYNQKKISFKFITTFNLDEYVNLKPKDINQSYLYFMQQNLFNLVDINPKNTYFPVDINRQIDFATDFSKYDQLILSKGGIDLQILGVGNNGHIAFNEPGSKIDSKTRIISLDESTIKANSRFFESINDVPKHAVSMGLDTILKAKKIILLVIGETKTAALNQLLNATHFDSNWPCTALVYHPNVTVYYVG